MKKTDAVKLIRKTFEAPFEREQFTLFLKELLNSFDESKAHKWKMVKESFSEQVASWERVGVYQKDERRIDTLIVYLKKETSLERARTMQRNFVAGYLRGDYGSTSEKHAALVAFVSADPADWRFSLVKLEYALKENEKGELSGIEKFTPARRWSFLVGAHENSHTAQSQLVPILEDDEHNPTLEDLENAFDIETVSDEFFTEYRRLFIETKLALDNALLAEPSLKSAFEAQQVNSVDFVKKLLGQIVFLYYLQKKGWFGVPKGGAWGEGSKFFLRELFKGRHGEYKNFFNDILEPLFYDALRRDRSEVDHYHVHFKCKIPFLNGGLFDPIGDYDWVNTDLLLPNELFANKEIVNGDEGTGILDVFDRYNFTVREDEPFEKEVAIDPELLGKAYEKFNAIRPDNFDEYQVALSDGKKGSESKFNKKFGVYYTPREIVHYMCQQSLIQYLHTALNEKKSYRELGSGQQGMFGNEIKRGQLAMTAEAELPEISQAEIEELILRGERIKENDARVVAAGRETSTYKFKMPPSIRANAARVDEVLAAVKVCDPAVGSGAFPVGMMNEIVKARGVLRTYSLPNAANLGGSTYQFKRACIENSLYGVDIDPGAVEIAKLRLWLSLIVDEEDPQNIKPLPNLDYKLMQGNSLLGLPEGALLNPETLEKLEERKISYFDETHPTKKKEYREEINSLFKKLVESARQFDPTLDEVNFDFHTHFSEAFQQNGGFDVVIGNPPYISAIEFINKYGSSLRDLLKKAYQTAKGTYDIYILFFEKGLLLTKRHGVLTYITPNKYLSARYAIALRDFIVQGYSLVHLVDLSSLNIFEEASVYPVISIIKNTKQSDNLVVLQPLDNFAKTFQARKFIPIHIEKDVLQLLPENLWGFFLSNQVELLQKLIQNSEELQSLGNVNATSTASEADEYGRFITNDTQGNDLRVINTGTIDKWTSLWGIAQMTHARNQYTTPYLSLEKANVNPRRQSIYRSPKIIFAKIAKNCEAFFDHNGEYASINTNCFYNPNKNVSLEFIAAICNSKMFMFLYEQLFGALRMSGGYFQFQAPQLRVMPIKTPSSDLNTRIIKLVKQILALKDSSPEADTSALEAQIDVLVYGLYGLTEEEIVVVEGKHE